MEIEYDRPATGERLIKIKRFLETSGLDWDEAITATVSLTKNGQIIATGSRQRNVLKCVAASPARQGEGLISTVMSELVKDAHAEGFSHLFIFTKPNNIEIFAGLGFYPLAETAGAALLENRRNGVSDYAASLKKPEAEGVIGAIVANCNPFTNGHRYLAETASRECSFVYMFILTEDSGGFPAETRFRLARDSVSDLKNVFVCPTGPYLVSYATLPDYFIKDKVMAKDINYGLDIALFAERFAKPLGIFRRYVGTEPSCVVTAGYNARMKELLPGYGIDVIEVQRREQNGQAVSASAVRALLAEGRLEEVRPLVPEAVYSYLKERNRDAR
ncbi:MAG: [citrate (pro-3S)-lyase] ligase [Clostridiales bacterium]|jgi:[citrate (pro-3S)-lyase] ligase|nr:[citrate (pro-3S)-lyase] ligase [Clostridiales bacterium]